MFGLEAIAAFGMGPGRTLSSDGPGGLASSPAGRLETMAARFSFLSSLADFALDAPAPPADPPGPFWTGFVGLGAFGAFAGAAELDASDIVRMMTGCTIVRGGGD